VWTNRNLDEAIANGTFRADLYHRLNVVKVTMPPLHERREDIPLLASYFAAKYAQACKRTVTGISPAARVLLQSYDWPGNVRELENAIESAIVLGSAEVIETDDLPERILESANGGKLPMARYYEAVKQAKQEIILKALEQAKGNYTEAAQRFGSPSEQPSQVNSYFGFEDRNREVDHQRKEARAHHLMRPPGGTCLRCSWSRPLKVAD